MSGWPCFFAASITLLLVGSCSATPLLQDGSRLPVVLNTWGFTGATSAAAKQLNQCKQPSKLEDRAAGQNSLLKEEEMDCLLGVIVAGCSECERERCDGSVGWGGSPDEEGTSTLDSMIMNGDNFDVGAVGSLKRIRNAIGVALRVMKHTFHTLLVGESATTFALRQGFPSETLSSVESSKIWSDWMAAGRTPNYWKDPSDGIPEHAQRRMVGHDTIGMLAVGADGQLACGTTTNGASHKIPGRVGDSPIVGAGAYCESGVGGATATGDGDQMMRFLPSFAAVNYMRAGISVEKACKLAMEPIAKNYPNASGGLVCVDASGRHSASLIGMPSFPYSVQTAHMSDPEVITVKL